MKVIYFIFGAFIGMLFDMMPVAIETMAGTNLCRESCPPRLLGMSIIVYMLMPVMWGIFIVLVATRRVAKKAVLLAVFFSMAIMALVTFFLYAYQHRLFS